MALMDFIKKQFIDVIHWTEETDGVLAYRYPMQDMEIQNGAQLTVRESQMAGFVNEGIMADVFNPGRFKLTTQVLPLLTNLMNWDKLFDAPLASSWTASGARRTRSRFATRTSARSACAPSASIPIALPIRSCSTRRCQARAKPTPWPTLTASCATA